MNQYLWKTKYGGEIHIKYMSDKYLLNVLKFLRRRATQNSVEDNPEYNWIDYLPKIYFNLAQLAADRNLEWYGKDELLYYDLIKDKNGRANTTT